MAEEADDADENWIERNSKTISTLATVSIPIVIAIFGYFANRSLQQDQLDQSYVVLAINTLKTELPVNERKDCIETVNDLGEGFDTAADLARAFQDKLSGPVVIDQGSTTTVVAPASTTTVAARASTGTDLPQTLFRSYALDLLLASTPATLTVPQYKALLCAETIVPPLTEQSIEPTVETQESSTTNELFNRLEANAVEADSDCTVVITGEVGVVGTNSVSARNEPYRVKRVAFDQVAAAAESADGTTAPPTPVLYLEVEVVSTDADNPTSLWIEWQPNVEIQPDPETCKP